MKSFLLPAALALTSAAALADAGHGHGDDRIGQPGKASQVSRTVRIDMSDAMRFTPSTLKVRQGETVRFLVRNSGRLKHEMVFATAEELQKHYQAMLRFPDMEHEDPNMVTVAPGQRGEIVWQFTRAGTIDFACLQPGHYDAGMKGAVQVSKAGDGHAHAH